MKIYIIAVMRLSFRLSRSKPIKIVLFAPFRVYFSSFVFERCEYKMNGPGFCAILCVLQFEFITEVDSFTDRTFLVMFLKPVKEELVNFEDFFYKRHPLKSDMM